MTSNLSSSLPCVGDNLNQDCDESYNESSANNKELDNTNNDLTSSSKSKLMIVSILYDRVWCCCIGIGILYSRTSDSLSLLTNYGVTSQSAVENANLIEAGSHVTDDKTIFTCGRNNLMEMPCKDIVIVDGLPSHFSVLNLQRMPWQHSFTRPNLALLMSIFWKRSRMCKTTYAQTMMYPVISSSMMYIIPGWSTCINKKMHDESIVFSCYIKWKHSNANHSSRGHIAKA